MGRGYLSEVQKPLAPPLLDTSRLWLLPTGFRANFETMVARVIVIFVGPHMYSIMVVSCILIINERSLGFGVRGGYIFM